METRKIKGCDLVNIKLFYIHHENKTFEKVSDMVLLVPFHSVKYYIKSDLYIHQADVLPDQEIIETIFPNGQIIYSTNYAVLCSGRKLSDSLLWKNQEFIDDVISFYGSDILRQIKSSL